MESRWTQRLSLNFEPLSELLILTKILASFFFFYGDVTIPVIWTIVDYLLRITDQRNPLSGFKKEKKNRNILRREGLQSCTSCF